MNIDQSLTQIKALTKSYEQMGPNQGSSNVHCSFINRENLPTPLKAAEE